MIVGLTGYAQSGKDTVAQILVNKYGFTRVAFADKIREFLYELNPVIKDGVKLREFVDAHGWDVAKVQESEVRRLLQEIGLTARKIFGDSFWINQALNPHIYEHPIVGVNKDIVVTDVRFTNEAEIIKSLGGKIWRIKRNGVEAVNNHVSEHEMDGYKVDSILVNRGTLDELELLVQTRMGALLNDN
jgi:dephospho-CoA kinase